MPSVGARRNTHHVMGLPACSILRKVPLYALRRGEDPPPTLHPWAKSAGIPSGGTKTLSTPRGGAKIAYQKLKVVECTMCVQNKNFPEKCPKWWTPN